MNSLSECLELVINENKLGMRNTTAFLRKKSEFEIAYLYARRNTLIHEGLTLAGDMRFFVQFIAETSNKGYISNAIVSIRARLGFHIKRI